LGWQVGACQMCAAEQATFDARTSGIYGMRRFARNLQQDIEAFRNAVPEHWSNGQTKGQINRLKTLKRAMDGPAGVDLLCARVMQLQA
jgi:transposase